MCGRKCREALSAKTDHFSQALSGSENHWKKQSSCYVIGYGLLAKFTVLINFVRHVKKGFLP